MKIAITKENIPFPCANVINTFKNAQGFYNLGHEVEVLTVKSIKEDIWKFKLNNIHKFYGIENDIPIKYFVGNFLFYFKKFFSPFLKIIKLFPKVYDIIDPEIKISNYIIKNNFDLGYCRGTYRTALHLLKNKIPIILDLHGVAHLHELKKILKFKNTKYFKGIITLNRFLKQRFIKIGFPSKKIIFMENAIDLKKYDKITNDKKKIREKLNLPINDDIILYSGKIKEGWGSQIIIDAIKLLKNYNYSFFFIGGGKLSKFKRKLNKDKYNQKKNKTKIVFLGMKPKSIIPYYLKAADLLLAIYSKKCTTKKYMSPVKVIEYMGSKTPFIATEIGRNIEICSNDVCMLTNPEDSRDLSNKIIYLMQEDKLKLKIAKNAYERAKKHTIEIRCNRILELMKNK